MESGRTHSPTGGQIRSADASDALKPRHRTAEHIRTSSAYKALADEKVCGVNGPVRHKSIRNAMLVRALEQRTMDQI